MKYTKKEITAGISYMENLLESVNEDDLEEAGLAVGGKAYPKNGNILIMAGGAGSGKSFILDKLLLFEGKLLNIDYTKEVLLKGIKRNPERYKKITDKFQKMFGYSICDIDQQNSKQATDLHFFLHDSGLQDSLENAFFANLKNMKSAEKPNVIFDASLKDTGKMEYYEKQAQIAGYQPENIHLVWVLNSLQTALKQNGERDRKMDPALLTGSHSKSANSIRRILFFIENFSINGDIWVVFNNRENNDVKLNVKKLENGKNISVVDQYVAYKLKDKGSKNINAAELLNNKDLLDKMLSYLPDGEANKFKNLLISLSSSDDIANVYFSYKSNERPN